MDKECDKHESHKEDPFPTASLPDLSAIIGDQIGPYKLLSVLGEGGFGIVYLAEQKHPIKRQVALKIIKPGMDSRRIVARFEAERQALALLDHPGIAHIFEAGSTESGRPYFVMEYINGMPITDYCDYHKLSIEDRLNLFIQVCQAVQHAHQKGIIHRDIKPSNIVVSLQDSKAIPKMIDFGVAKALGMPLTDKTLFTQQGQLIGTPEYMSPEQADQREQDIDTRTDIYSLGIILYELLAGTLPFESNTLREAGYAAIGRIIKEQEPPRPSTKLSHLGQEATQVAHNRRIELPSLVKSLHKELEWIPLMAIRKERELRYQTASDLAEDIQHYVEGHPLKAGPESAGYRVRKFIRRHKGLAAALAAISTIIIVGLIIICALYLHAEKSKIEALAAKAETEKQLYYNRMALADTAKVNNVEYARQLLDACPTKLRGWEWEWLNSNLDHSLLTLRGHQSFVHSVCFSPDGKRIASGSSDGTIKIWDADNGTELKTLSGHNKSIYEVCFSPDGKRIASGGDDKTIIIWDSTTGRQLLEPLSGHTNSVNSVCYSPDGKRIASGSSDKTIKIWDAQSGYEVRTLSGHQGIIYAVCFSPDGKWIASGSLDKTIIIWDSNTGEPLRTLIGHQRVIASVCFSPDSKQIVSGSTDKQIIIWDTDTWNQLRTLSGHQSFVLDVCFSPDGRQIVSGSSDTTIKIWEARSGRQIRTLSGYQNAIFTIRFSPDGKRIASGSDNTVKIWDAGGPHQQTIPLNSPQARFLSACSSPDGKWIAIGTSDKTIELYDVDSGHVIRTFNGHEGEVLCVCFSADGRRIASVSSDQKIIIWDADTSRQLLRLLEDHTGTIKAVCFSPDGRQIASTGFDTIKLWDADNGCLLWTNSGYHLSTPCFSPDGKQIIVEADYGTIKIWDAQNGHEIQTLSGHHGWVYVVCFSPDGTQMASGSMDNTIKIWDTGSGHEIRTLNGHLGAVSSICFSPDGKRIVSGSADNTIKMWDTDSGTPLLTLSGHHSAVALVYFSPDGKRIVSLDNDGAILVWNAGQKTDINQVIQ